MTAKEKAEIIADATYNAICIMSKACPLLTTDDPDWEGVEADIHRDANKAIEALSDLRDHLCDFTINNAGKYAEEKIWEVQGQALVELTEEDPAHWVVSILLRPGKAEYVEHHGRKFVKK